MNNMTSKNYKFEPEEECTLTLDEWMAQQNDVERIGSRTVNIEELLSSCDALQPPKL